MLIIITLAIFITLTIAIKLAEEREEYVPTPAVEFTAHVNEYDEVHVRGEHCVQCGGYAGANSPFCSDECYVACVSEVSEVSARAPAVESWDFDDIPF